MGLLDSLPNGAGIGMVANPIFGFPTILLSKIKDQNSFSSVKIDAMIQEKHTYKNLITDNPLETGQPITDNVVNLPVLLQMKGRITTTPIDIFSALINTAAGAAASGVAGILKLPSGTVGAAASIVAGLLNSAPSSTRHLSAFNQLVTFWFQKTKLEIVTGLAVYQNMVIEEMSFPREIKDGRSLVFDAIFKQIIIVDTTVGVNISKVGPAFINGIPTNLGPTSPISIF